LSEHPKSTIGPIKPMKANFVITNPVHFLALGFGSGLMKPAPGTWGTIAAVPLILLTSYFVAFDSYLFVFICVLSFILGIYLCGKAARDVGVHDHSAIVWDEFVGLFVSMMWLPMNSLADFMAGQTCARWFWNHG